MAGNDWINSYLEAILDAGGAADEISAAASGGGEGAAGEKRDKSSLMLRERGRFSPARYFVEEVISGFDETDLYKTWVRTAAMRSPQDRNTRLENMSWRIWNLARKKKQIEGEEASRLSKRRLEREKARQYAAADLSEDLSEGEKGDNINELSVHDDSMRVRMPRIGSTDAIEAWASQHKDKKLYIVLIRFNIRSIYRVDLLTRQISAPDVDWSYGEPTEMLSPRGSESIGHEMGESSGAYIVRIPFGPRDKYIPKEHLWPHIQEFVDGALVHIMQMSKVLGEQIGSGQPVWPVVIYMDTMLMPVILLLYCLGHSMCPWYSQAIPPGMEFSHIAPHDVDLDGEEGNEDGLGSPDPPIWADIMRFFSNPRKPMILALARPDPKKNITTLVKAFGEHRELRNLANLTLIMGNRDVIDEMSSTNAAVLTSVLKLIDKYDLYGQVAYPKHHKQSEVPDIYRLAARTKVIKSSVLALYCDQNVKGSCDVSLLRLLRMVYQWLLPGNGGPVDIHRVLDNGILVDPHNQNEIAEALYKLVSDKHLWAQCRQNDSPEDSLRDIHDISLNLKISLDSEKSASKDGNSTAVRRHIEDAVQKLSRGDSANRKDESGDNTEATTGSSKWPSLQRRKHIIVIAIDSVQDADFVQVIKNIFAASSNERLTGAIGFVLSTSRAISEIHALLILEGIETSDFDAFICNSGSDVCYPSLSSEDMLSPGELPFMIDLDYHSQIEYRWGGEGLRKTLLRWATEQNNERGQKIVVEDEECSSMYCISFKVKNTEAVPPVKELRRTMRIQALRCHVLYSHDGSKLNVIPVLASRSQALRYLYIRWGVDLSNMTVIVGESGDTDYEGLLGGVHKTIILKGSFNAPPNQVHAARSYLLQDVVSFEKQGIASVEGYGPDNLKSTLQQFVELRRLFYTSSRVEDAGAGAMDGWILGDCLTQHRSSSFIHGSTPSA
ncbi:hypothetical protein PR202_gn00498 [Eleusine coracana subsp. coracana]|uniref:Sucrose phosphatase-like domain-containing protein n=1 Tax=Eleusine coracana subsp. coracana TaxID=191504 RepID=A0AAV5G3X9_ELECO|nr:hypothetical protein PR202_gn00498 [Eleusine coracana subsp. coracana]